MIITDQGTDFKGVFANRNLAEKYILEQESNEHERQWWNVYEEEVQTS